MYLFRLDTSVPGVRYCTCSGKQQQSGTKVEENISCKYQQKYIPFSNQGEGWQPYVERADLLVWRREHASKRGLYEYKLYGQVIQCFHHSIDIKIEELTGDVFSLTT